MSIARTIEATAEFGNNLIEANAEIGNRNIDATAGMSTTIEHIYTEGGALPKGGVPGDILIKKTSTDYDAEWVAPATSAEQDNTRPITAGAVYTEIGNINALLATI